MIVIVLFNLSIIFPGVCISALLLFKKVNDSALSIKYQIKVSNQRPILYQIY